jgi:hypothetical protein
MNLRRLAMVVAVCLFLIFMHPVMNAQVRPICDVTCAPGPDPTITSSYRVLPINDRGIGGGIPRRHWPPKPPKPPKPAELVLGSSSYEYDVPLFFLPGRNGLNLNLAAHYNSGIWSEDTVHRTISFNADRDNPSYGFRVDFGFIDMQSTPYILTEPDGTKHLIDADLLTTTDGSNIKFDTTQLTATYKNGNVVFYEYTSSSGLFLRPVKIRDTNGNFIKHRLCTWERVCHQHYYGYAGSPSRLRLRWIRQAGLRCIGKQDDYFLLESNHIPFGIFLFSAHGEE